MFTGIVEGLGKIESVISTSRGAKLCVHCAFGINDVRLGDSISVNGICLTVTKIEANLFWADASCETLSKTTLAFCRVGDRVNLERALRFGDRLGGHLVTGHIDTVATLGGRKEVGNSVQFRLDICSKYLRYVVAKGSVAIDGISLTVNRCVQGGFEVNVIPHTCQITTIGNKKVGDRVNIETDLIGKYVERFTKPYGENIASNIDSADLGLDKAFMEKVGFL